MKTIKWLENIQFTKKVEVTLMQESKSSKEIRIIMPEGSVMKEHKAPNEIMVQVLEGKIWFEVENKKYNFEKGSMITLEALIPHSLGGLEDSILRLSLGKDDGIKRVQGVLKR